MSLCVYGVQLAYPTISWSNCICPSKIKKHMTCLHACMHNMASAITTCNDLNLYLDHITFTLMIVKPPPAA